MTLLDNGVGSITGLGAVITAGFLANLDVQINQQQDTFGAIVA